MLHWIAADFFARSPLLALPVAGLVICLLVYLSAALRAFFAPRGELERMARLPLEGPSTGTSTHRTREVDDV
jgi:hypothetical protein